ncbi:MAG: PEP-CTERM sorting domain-containing protein [Proteobacteria bacterium]|nr:PEP-CTERM sorting domain-containing protein [Pseudomonadota bacterium]
MRVRLTAAMGPVIALVSSVANAQLTTVTHDGVTLVDDSSLNVTWIADASLSGPVTWSSSAAPGSAQAFVASLNASDYGGYNDWTLPTGDGVYTTNPIAFGGVVQQGWGLSTDPTKNQLGWLFFNELGNQFQHPMSNAGPFMNVNRNGFFWSSDNYFNPQIPDFGPAAWAYLNGAGLEVLNYEGYMGEVLAVRSGEVPVPEPAMFSLLALGLGGLGFMRLRSKKPECWR